MGLAALWVPCLVFAHAFAAIWLVRAALLASGKSRKSEKEAQPGDELGAVHIDGPAEGTAGASPSHSSGASEDLGIAIVQRHVSSTDSKAITISNSWTGPHHISWEGIGCSYEQRGSTKVVLQGVHGEAHAGQMQALIGPSGAAKSTLMDILAMRKTVGSLSGQLLVDGQAAGSSYLRSTSYVSQEDTFIPTMTCEETLAFYAAVILPGAAKQRQVQVQGVLREMGLAAASDTLVGGTLPGGLTVRGLSGGERRRLSIAVGVLGSPSVLFLDEPTSGLDSFAALNVMGYLRAMAVAEQQIVIATIHQPRSAIWSMFDTVTLLSSGRLMYHGPCQMMTPWFESLGYKLTSGSEADWVLDLVAVGFDKPLGQLEGTMRTHADVQAASDAFCSAHCKPAAAAAGSLHTAPRPSWRAAYPTGWVRQFSALLVREVANITRNPYDVAGRVLTGVWMGLMFGLLFFNMSVSSLDSLRNRINLLFGMVVAIMMVPFTSISLYTADKRIHLADAAAKRYRLTAYYAAKVTASTPFNVVVALCFAWVAYGMAGLRPGVDHIAAFGAVLVLCYLIAAQMLHLCVTVAANQDTAFGAVVLWSSMNILFSSFFMNFQQVSLYGITLLRYLSAGYYALEALVVNEFSGTQMSCEAGMDGNTASLLTNLFTNASPAQRATFRQMQRPQPGCVISADAVVQYFDYHRGFGTSLGLLLAYLGALHLLTLAGLAILARKEAR